MKAENVEVTRDPNGTIRLAFALGPTHKNIELLDEATAKQLADDILSAVRRGTE